MWWPIDDVFICLPCNDLGGISLVDLGHDEYHSLVRIGEMKDPGNETRNDIDTKFQELQAKIQKVEEHMQDMNQKHGKIEIQFQEVVKRQTLVEDHIQCVLDQQIRVEGQIQTMSERQSRIEDMLQKLMDHLFNTKVE